MNRRELLSGAALLAGTVQADAFGVGRLGLGEGRGGALGGAQLVPAGAAATAALARLPATPSTVTRNKMVTAINALDAGGWWATMDFFHLYAADNTPNSLIDLTGNGHNAALNGLQTFYPRVGWKGDGSTFYLSTNFTPSTQGVNYTQNSMSMGVMVANNRAVADGSVVMGSIDGSTTFDQIAPLFTGNVAIGTMATSGSGIQVASTSARGLWIGTRTGASAEVLYLNGTSIGSNATASTARTTHPILVCARYTNGGGAGTVGNFSSDTVSLAFGRSGSSAADAAGINSALAGLMPASVPATIADAWNFTNTTLNWTPTNLSDIDMTFANDPTKKWFFTQFWGAGNPNAEATFSGGAVVLNSTVFTNEYRMRMSTRGNTSSIFQGSLSGVDLVVTAMLGVTAGGGTNNYSNPILVGQRVCGNNMSLTQPLNGPRILLQKTPLLGGEALGGIGRYTLDTSFGSITSQVFNGYSDVGSVPRFKAGGHFEATIMYDPSLSPAVGATIGDVVTVELVGINSLWGKNFTNPSYDSKMNAGEVDLIQNYPSATPGAPRWLISLINEVVAAYYNEWSFTVANPNEGTFAQLGSPNFLTAGGLKVALDWIPSQMNGGTGMMFFSIGGTRITMFDKFYAAGTSFAAIDGDEVVMQIDPGYNQPTSVFNVLVKQTP